jgi:hypothetical protein
MRTFMMKRKFMLRKIIVVAIASALCGFVLPTSAFARGSTFEHGRLAGSANVDRNDRVLHGPERGYGGRPWVQRGYKWDPWGHWGTYYGPMVHTI